jgi:PAS domain S-box-containing protein/putative nucleotidyltransferase with HDIG domain
LFSEVITARKQTEEAILERERQMRALVTSLDDIVFEYDEQGIYLNVWTADETLLAQPKTQLLGQRIADVLGEENSRPITEALQRVLESGIPESIEYPLEVIGGQRWFMARISPIFNKDETKRTASMLVRDITERKQAEMQIQRQLQRISALNEIDRAISSSMDLRLSINVLLDKVLSQLGVDAASVLIMNTSNQALEYFAGNGFQALAIRQSRLRLGEGLAGRVGLERKVIHVPNLAEVRSEFTRTELLRDEALVEYFGVPLIAKGALKGVLEIFNRNPMDPDLEWVNYLETLGGQAAIAIDSAQLFEGMQQSNLELITAYDATIEGWSHAMDLRDKETEGHTQRVTELTLKLAERMGISQQELGHLRRGALLHDIGKLGVPDQILFKTGELNEEEWALMRQHPTYAFEMLKRINYLRPALDIPFCHHEKWDGSGYPRGLKAEEIPLAARIFAVVDVWDALRSDRPYRARWTAEQAREYILQQSGKHFDPQVVDIFLKMLDDH